MISGTPSLFVASLSSRRLAGIESFVDDYAREFVRYGSGKVALRDGLAGLVEAGQNVLVPAYLPDAVVEPFLELGLEPRHYAIEPSLAPDVADLERRIDANTAAVLSVNYFGFPQPGLSELQSIVADYDCYHVDDNAHAPLSVDGDTLLGTRGHLGLTCLWKLLPTPNGALLYLNDESVRERYDPSTASGISESMNGTDYRFVLTSIVGDLLDEHGPVRRSIDAILEGRQQTPAVGSPTARYEAGKKPMSKLAARIADDADPEPIRSTRRENYRAWQRILEDHDHLEFVYESLPPGICPQAAPVRVTDAEAVRSELRRCGVGGVKSWPRLPSTVRDDPTYATATTLAREIYTLPVHQHVDTAAIEAVGDRLRC
ncbi:DegT/DnrJ/EryC1/StrS aminotransferase family protein [Salinadaptatus halalkaliphilus]|uniref:DegT/DnrJ/EryC1/StrS aminotransferase family protein n=1 Tax=Salinadaptatus halalkaliphilus TaxID=2419781 RepID=A0A4S3TNK9_9EURY|nr:DegT/DnrJ/EryC1/StrS family aminotransferase [Salinadaptatus halalkaliphilus]THE64823.1 DegT/DnrJ/EryC1/StrS aminotransferase family protein [Salinadaptatus halalkaliphilus]